MIPAHKIPQDGNFSGCCSAKSFVHVQKMFAPEIFTEPPAALRILHDVTNRRCRAVSQDTEEEPVPELQAGKWTDDDPADGLPESVKRD